MTEKEPLLADVVFGRRFAIAEMDGFHRNRWTNWIGLGGRVQSEWVDDLDRNGWTGSGGIVNPRGRARLLQAKIPVRFRARGGSLQLRNGPNRVLGVGLGEEHGDGPQPSGGPDDEPRPAGMSRTLKLMLGVAGGAALAAAAYVWSRRSLTSPAEE